MYNADALAWLREHAPLTGASVITSLPDISELAGLDLGGWQVWFQDAAFHTMKILSGSHRHVESTRHKYLANAVVAKCRDGDRNKRPCDGP